MNSKDMDEKPDKPSLEALRKISEEIKAQSAKVITDSNTLRARCDALTKLVKKLRDLHSD